MGRHWMVLLMTIFCLLDLSLAQAGSIVITQDEQGTPVITRQGARTKPRSVPDPEPAPAPAATSAQTPTATPDTQAPAKPRSVFEQPSRTIFDLAEEKVRQATKAMNKPLPRFPK